MSEFMLKLLSLDQLAHKASVEDNALALCILERMEDAISDAVKEATATNDSGYSYKIWDAVNAVERLLNAEWFKVEETRLTKDRIIYQFGLHEDTNPHNNHVEIFKYKGSDVWYIRANGGEYGEDSLNKEFHASGFKDAQKKATDILIFEIKNGFELNV